MQAAPWFWFASTNMQAVAWFWFASTNKRGKEKLLVDRSWFLWCHSQMQFYLWSDFQGLIINGSWLSRMLRKPPLEFFHCEFCRNLHENQQHSDNEDCLHHASCNCNLHTPPRANKWDLCKMWPSFNLHPPTWKLWSSFNLHPPMNEANPSRFSSKWGWVRVCAEKFALPERAQQSWHP